MSDFKLTKRLSKKSPDYVPTFEELGITEQEALQYSPEAYERLIQSWRSNYLKICKDKAIRKKEKLDLKLFNHWFKVFDDDKKIELILDSTKHINDVIKDISKRKTLIKISVYNINVCERARTGKVELRPIDLIKLSKFPEYNKEKDCLCGTSEQFIRLWAFVFRPVNRSKLEKFGY